MQKRTFTFILCIATIITICGCNAASSDTEPAKETQSAPSVEAAVTDQPMESTAQAVSAVPIPDYLTPIDFTWQPQVMSEVYTQVYGDQFVTEFNSMVDAFLAYKETFTCSSSENADAINTAAACCFPLLSMDVGRVVYDEEQNVGILTYVWSEEDHLAGIKQFDDTITDFITSCVMKSDDSVTAAMAMYMAYARMITYDDAAASDDMLVDVSSYRGLTQYAGICQTFGPAYAYLCLQLGIDAVNAGGLSTDDLAHDWTLVKLNDSHYYMDTTFENGDGGNGLMYFGMTTADRFNAGKYTEEFINIGSTNLLWGPDIAADDDRFSPLRTAGYAELNREMNSVFYTDVDGNYCTFSLD